MTEEQCCGATLKTGPHEFYYCRRERGHQLKSDYDYDTEHHTDETDDNGITYEVTWQGPVEEDS